MPALTRGRSTSLRLSAGSPLLRLPEGVLRVVFGWSPDTPTAQALSNTCRALHALRGDPAAVALLLIHCPCVDAESAIVSSSAACEGGVHAVVHQLLQLLRASPDCGGPYTAPPPLLQAMLNMSAYTGDADSIRSILRLPSPPSFDGDSGRTLLWAMHTGPHLAALQALLEGGANPSVGSGIVFYKAGGTLRHFAALPLLLQHCRPPALGDAIDIALTNAIAHEAVAIVDYLLPLIDAAGGDFLGAARQAAREGRPRVLRRLRDHCCSAEMLRTLMEGAASQDRAACVTVLLDRGALVHPPNTPQPLALAVLGATQAGVPAKHGHATVKLLLRRGAQVTPAMRTQAADAGKAALLALQRAANGPPPAAPGP